LVSGVAGAFPLIRCESDRGIPPTLFAAPAGACHSPGTTQQTEIEMIARFAILPTLALGLTAGLALAQETAPADPAAPPATTEAPAAVPAQDNGAAYESARNQLGVLAYCQEQGHIDGTAVEIQTKLLAMIPAGDTAMGDAAEAKGKEGTVSAMGVERTLADAATEQNTTEEALCKQMEGLLQQLASQVPA
jgi:hypothetical protein